jgi:hypothetical protein
MYKYQAKIVNFLISTDLEFSVEHFQIKLIQQEEYKVRDRNELSRHDKEDTLIYTTDIVVESVDKNSKDDIQIVIDNICWLLSFISSSTITKYSWTWFKDGKEKESTWRPLPGAMRRHSHPIFCPWDVNEIKGFITQTYDRYKSVKSDRKLDVAIHYCVLAEREGTPQELRLIILVVLFENLKNTFGEQKYPRKDKSFDFQDTKGKRLSFNYLLTEMFSEVGMTEDEISSLPSKIKGIVDLRNELLHTALTKMSPQEQHNQYLLLRDLIQEYLLRLLHYKGVYYPNYSERLMASPKYLL